MRNNIVNITITILAATILFIIAFNLGDSRCETRIDKLAKSQGYVTVNSHVYRAIAAVKTNE